MGEAPAHGEDLEHAARAEAPPAAPRWAGASDQELLSYRIKDLGLTLEGSGLEKKIDQLERELDFRGICFHPPCYLGVEWACPDEVPAIAIAFYLAHPRLKRLEKKMMLEVEGGTHGEFMRIIRHECGHAINYAFLLHRRKRWTELFGSFQAEYRDAYRVRPYSRRFVRNLEGWYAQMHPDEDFAETFAVWLNPRSEWRETYEGWGALEKLEYVDELMRKEVIDHAPKVMPKKRDFLWHVDRLAATLAAHYRRRRAEHAHEYSDYYDRELTQLFTDHPGISGRPAAEFLRIHKTRIIDTVSKWSLENKHNIKMLLNTVIGRCRELRLKVPIAEEEELLEVVSYLASLAVNYKFTGQFKRHR
jgi:hypothetical protein